MVLAFLGWKNEDVYKGDLNHLCGLLAQSVQSLVSKGLVQEEKLDARGNSFVDEGSGQKE
ncbi:unnamed protein product [Urochloa humidicola]